MGPSKAHAFLKEYDTPEKRQGILAAFWSVLECFSQDAPRDAPPQLEAKQGAQEVSDEGGDDSSKSALGAAASVLNVPRGGRVAKTETEPGQASVSVVKSSSSPCRALKRRRL